VTIDWSQIFDRFGVKRVSATDIGKSAYVPNEAQRAAIAAAGIKPSAGGSNVTFDLATMFDPKVPVLKSTYYPSLRAGSGRGPEMRMGQGIISWIRPGDTLVIGNIGKKLFAVKAATAQLPAADTGREFSRKLDPKTIFRNARKAKGKPATRSRTTTDYVRNPYVVAAAILRSGGTCEMPKCKHVLFLRDDGSPFLEVHHITPLSEGGDDTLRNAAALCPMCHREAHHGANRRKKRAHLHAYIASIPVP